jgi:hypothetical protein
MKTPNYFVDRTRNSQLRKKSAAMHHGIVTIPPLSATQFGYFSKLTARKFTTAYNSPGLGRLCSNNLSLSELVVFVYIFGQVLQHVSLESKRRISGGGTAFTFTVTSSQSHIYTGPIIFSCIGYRSFQLSANTTGKT